MKAELPGAPVALSFSSGYYLSVLTFQEMTLSGLRTKDTRRGWHRRQGLAMVCVFMFTCAGMRVHMSWKPWFPAVSVYAEMLWG